VAAIIHCGDGQYLLQHRDAIPTIFYPDRWGFFGGAIEPEESPNDALRRELDEELQLDLAACSVKFFGRFDFNVEPAGIAAFDRLYFDVEIRAERVLNLRLGEGQAMRLVGGHNALHDLQMVPYDSFALWLHYNQSVLRT
jgi:8-oxo-dGTP pyrophosphatase MutT (NUDIX family)